MWSANYIYVPIQYNFVISIFHRYYNYLYCLNLLLLSAALQRKLLLCFRTVSVFCFVNFVNTLTHTVNTVHPPLTEATQQ